MKQEPRPHGARSRQFVPPIENSRFSKRTLLALTQNLLCCLSYIPKRQFSNAYEIYDSTVIRSKRLLPWLGKTFPERFFRKQFRLQRFNYPSRPKACPLEFSAKLTMKLVPLVLTARFSMEFEEFCPRCRKLPREPHRF